MTKEILKMNECYTYEEVRDHASENNFDMDEYGREGICGEFFIVVKDRYDDVISLVMEGFKGDMPIYKVIYEEIAY